PRAQCGQPRPLEEFASIHRLNSDRTVRDKSAHPARVIMPESIRKDYGSRDIGSSKGGASVLPGNPRWLPAKGMTRDGCTAGVDVSPLIPLRSAKTPRGMRPRTRETKR